jgi:hypothetical protein
MRLLRKYRRLVYRVHFVLFYVLQRCHKDAIDGNSKADEGDDKNGHDHETSFNFLFLSETACLLIDSHISPTVLMRLNALAMV